MIQKVRHVMKALSPTVDAEVNVTEATHVMIQSGEDTLIVLEKEKLKGTVNLRNIIRYTYTQGFRPNQTPVGEITNLDIVFARPNTSLVDALTVMIETKQDTLPVVNDELVGLINIYDLLKAQPKTRPLSVSPHIA
jgi:CBS domain-containing protein